jgi:hypothetical protein
LSVQDTDTPNSGYEKSDVKLGKIALWGTTATVILVALIMFSLDFFKVTREELIYDMVLKPESVKLIELRMRESEELTSYSVIDAEKGIYRIPIEEAMKIIIKEANRNRNTGR